MWLELHEEIIALKKKKSICREERKGTLEKEKQEREPRGARRRAVNRLAYPCR